MLTLDQEFMMPQTNQSAKLNFVVTNTLIVRDIQQSVKEPLAGMSPKAILINVGKGDLSAPNPRTTQLLRAGGYADVTTFYRNDFAYAEDHSI
jgi:hypothetical protein